MSTQTRVKHETSHGLAYQPDNADGEASGSNESRNGHAKTSSDSNGLIVENPAYPLTPDLAESLDALRASHLRARAIAEESIVTPDMRREEADLRLRVLRTFGGHDLDTVQNELRDSALRRKDQIASTIREHVRKGSIPVADIFKWSDQLVVQPAPIDHSFWWARTDSTVAPGMRALFQNDGLHFVGVCQINDDGTLDSSFGATAKFALQPERFPTAPPSGMFVSRPHVELFGGIRAFAPNFHWIYGNGIAECGMFLRQTLFRWVLGGAFVVGEATASNVIHIRLENIGADRLLPMPGFQALPEVKYNQNHLPPNELWAEIEVRFNIHLNSPGANVACDPQVLLRTFQWAPEPLP
jgi:hypothetical protein